MDKTEGQEALYRQAAADHGTALERLARSYEADPDKRRDLLQEIHLAIWRSFETFDGRCSLRTWVYRVSHNVAAAHVIKNRRLADKFVRLEDVAEPANDDSAAHDQEHTLSKLYAFIGQLNLIDHAVIVLYLEGEDAGSIAAVTGLSPANVATKIHRIKRLLAQRFSEVSTP